MMTWFNQLTDILDKYGSENRTTVPESVDDDFDRFSQHAPSSTVSDGLAEASVRPKSPSVRRPDGKRLSNASVKAQEIRWSRNDHRPSVISSKGAASRSRSVPRRDDSRRSTREEIPASDRRKRAKRKVKSGYGDQDDR